MAGAGSSAADRCISVHIDEPIAPHNMLQAEGRRCSLEVPVLDKPVVRFARDRKSGLYGPSGRLLGTRLVATGDR
jgi:hypothetical protein